MSKARALALPYAISKLLRQRSPHPVAAPGLLDDDASQWVGQANRRFRLMVTS